MTDMEENVSDSRGGPTGVVVPDRAGEEGLEDERGEEENRLEERGLDEIRANVLLLHDLAHGLLELERTREACSAMRQSGCMRCARGVDAAARTFLRERKVQLGRFDEGERVRRGKEVHRGRAAVSPRVVVLERHSRATYKGNPEMTNLSLSHRFPPRDGLCDRRTQVPSALPARTPRGMHSLLR